jgi:hypothetical protein
MSLSPMSPHRRLASAELRRDLFVQQTGHDEGHDFTLALRQGCVPPSQLGHLPVDVGHECRAGETQQQRGHDPPLVAQ